MWHNLSWVLLVLVLWSVKPATLVRHTVVTTQDDFYSRAAGIGVLISSGADTNPAMCGRDTSWCALVNMLSCNDSILWPYSTLVSGVQHL